MCENKVRVYISGKISNVPDGNKAKFKAAQTLIEAKGYEAINPHNLNHENHGKTWEEYMAVDLAALETCNAIYLLDDWHDSEGAKVELRRAFEMNLLVLDCKQLALLK